MELAVYCLLALAPIITVFLLLVIARRSAKQAMPVAYLVTSAIALLIWRVPLSVLVASTVQGLVMAAEILYIIFGAILLLNVLRESTLHRRKTTVPALTAFRGQERSLLFAADC